MTTRTTNTGTQTLGYDIQNRLQAITGAGPDLAALYDAEGNRVKRTLDTDVTYYLGDNHETTIPAGGPQHVTIHFTHAGMTVGTSVDGTLWALATDHLGSTNITRDSSGVTSQQRYTPHGTRRGGGPNTLPVDRTYTGQTDDPGTGLIDSNARHYDPTLGRFTQPDTVLDGLNRYTYVHNNPLNATDPTGHVVCRVGVCVPTPSDLVDGADAVASTVGGAATIVADKTIAVTSEVADRGSNSAQYAYHSNRRRAGNPLPTAWDLSSGSLPLEMVVAQTQILAVGADVDRSTAACRSEMECLTGAISPKAAITLGHTVSVGGSFISARLSQHEYQHVLDLESTGGLAFYGTYVAHSTWLKATTGNGYDGIVWERRADGRSAIAGGQSSIGCDTTSVAGRAPGVIGRYASNAVGGAARRGFNAWNAGEKLLTNWRYR